MSVYIFVKPSLLDDINMFLSISVNFFTRKNCLACNYIRS